MPAILLIGRIASGPATRRAQELSRSAILLAKKLSLPVLAALLLDQIFPSTAHALAPSIATGEARSCAVNSSGGVFCWGDNTGGALGKGTPIMSLSPLPVRGLSAQVAAIGSGSRHSCALTTAGGALCWGNNLRGQLGTGTNTNSSVPGPVNGLSSGVTAIGGGNYHTCALTTAGGVWCWGLNLFGRLGYGSMEDVWGGSPVSVTGLTSGVSAIAVGLEHTCALTTAGAGLCWGRNREGQLGNGTTTNSSVPVSVTGLPSGVAAIAAGLYHTCALTTAGGVLCWGYNYSGELGNGATTNSSAPVPVTGLSSGISAVATGGYHTCALTRDGRVLCWGYNYYGQLGDGTTNNSLTPISTGLSSPVSAIATGEVHSCALTTGGGVLCWGGNTDLQLGNGQAVGVSTPVAAVGLSSGIVAVATGVAHSCALTSGGDVLCWGEDSDGQLGIGTFGTSSAVPLRTQLSSAAASISTRKDHTCALTTSGGAMCWGYNYYGQLGIGTNSSSSVPVQVTGLASGVASIQAGGYHSCALTTAGNVLCSGYNLYGQLGNGSTTDTSLPVSVSGLSSRVTAIATGGWHNCALTVAGAVQCWGHNIFGQLGNGTKTDSTTAVSVTGLSSGVAG